MSTFRRDTPGALTPPSVSVLFVISGHWCGHASLSALVFSEGTSCLGARQLAKLVTRPLSTETSPRDETQACADREQVPRSTKPFTQITSNGLVICLSSFMTLLHTRGSYSHKHFGSPAEISRIEKVLMISVIYF